MATCDYWRSSIRYFVYRTRNSLCEMVHPLITCKSHGVVEVDQHEGCWVCNIENRQGEGIERFFDVEGTHTIDKATVDGCNNALIFAGLVQEQNALQKGYLMENFHVYIQSRIKFVPKAKKVHT